ncbi:MULTISPECIES: ABC transporter ATP-binding protein [Microbacterium]|jgi:iron complex transport system ATP-binding protein|uniref:ABC transporter n=2 Tax=Microbacterium TaxID=33882 RepID=A0A4Y4B9W0_MICMQ|nr:MULTISPECIES: ABC transporter ATP-binding protein [Microbacterium]AZS45665.1 Ferric enterobactin transport ATP-binding protein FepC [Microbacterium oxydans]KQV00033.1 iron-dicitrate transporter ATP-binding subunit [Microbacterium sp. Root322]WKT90780.1 ABC transporter ATP-binding protein [Microbacterium liquefaciens]GEC76339.1 ABC transporter [Microbacterium liquefaciens]GGV60082.1 ABC transporter [Microbacterium liquefaciens]
MTTQHPTLEARGLVVAYDGKVVVDGVDLALPEGSFTVILGPNASGKSTVLRALARVLKPESGDVLFDGRALSEYGSKELARRMGLLPQDAIAPEGMRVADLVSRGRYPHHSALQRWTSADDAATREALAATNTADLAERYVDQLSGGQRQRVWVALLLAQQTPVMLLDEPTTFLDIAHQYELLDLLRALNQQGKTVIAVLHDLNQAARYADNLVLMKEGRVVASGNPSELITAERVGEVFGIDAIVTPDPVTRTPMVIRR